MKILSPLLTLAVLLGATSVMADSSPKILRDCADCPPLVVIAPGSFTMGADEAEAKRYNLPEFWGVRERPKHRVVIAQAFALGQSEITRAAFTAFVRDTGYAPASGCWHFVGSEWEWDEKRSWENPGFAQGEDHPVTCINWHDANAFITWLSRKTGKAYRLPSEAEWEYAARAGTQTAFWFGNDENEVCAHMNLGDLDTRDATDWAGKKIKYQVMDDWKGQPCRDGFPFMAPVEAKPANPFGLFGMGGNGNEWVADCWHETYADTPGEQAPRVIGGDCGLRAMRGQGWTGGAAGTRSAFRLKMNATDRRFTFAFRIARDLAAEEMR